MVASHTCVMLVRSFPRRLRCAELDCSRVVETEPDETLLDRLCLPCRRDDPRPRHGAMADVRMGRQPDGSFLVSTGQRIEGGSIAFTGRPIDLAMHPTRDLLPS